MNKNATEPNQDPWRKGTGGGGGMQRDTDSACRSSENERDISLHRVDGVCGRCSCAQASDPKLFCEDRAG